MGCAPSHAVLLPDDKLRSSLFWTEPDSPTALVGGGGGYEEEGAELTHEDFAYALAANASPGRVQETYDFGPTGSKILGCAKVLWRESSHIPG